MTRRYFCFTLTDVIQTIKDGDVTHFKFLFSDQIYGEENLIEAIDLLFDNLRLSREIWFFLKTHEEIWRYSVKQKRKVLKRNVWHKFKAMCQKDYVDGKTRFAQNDLPDILSRAIHYDRKEMVELLLMIPENDINSKVKFYSTPNQEFHLKYSHTKYIEVDQECNNFPLMEAILQEDIFYLNSLLEKNADVNNQQKNESDFSALAFASLLGMEDKVQALLAVEDIDVNVRTEGLTPLHIACEKKHDGCAKLLLQHPKIQKEIRIEGILDPDYVPRWVCNSTRPGDYRRAEKRMKKTLARVLPNEQKNRCSCVLF